MARLKRWGYSNKFYVFVLNIHANYNLRNVWLKNEILKQIDNNKNNNNNNKNGRPLYLVKLYQTTLDNHHFLKFLINKHLVNANMPRDHIE